MHLQSSSGASTEIYLTQSSMTGTMSVLSCSRLCCQRYLLQELTVRIGLSHLIYALKTPESAVTDFDNGSLGSGEDSARMAFQTRKIIDEFHRTVTAPQRAPFPVVAALHGHVIGLGVDFIAACDIRYAASNTSFSIKVCPGYICTTQSFINILPGNRHWCGSSHGYSCLSSKNNRK